MKTTAFLVAWLAAVLVSAWPAHAITNADCGGTRGYASLCAVDGKILPSQSRNAAIVVHGENGVYFSGTVTNSTTSTATSTGTVPITVTNTVTNTSTVTVSDAGTTTITGTVAGFSAQLYDPTGTAIGTGSGTRTTTWTNTGTVGAGASGTSTGTASSTDNTMVAVYGSTQTFSGSATTTLTWTFTGTGTGTSTTTNTGSGTVTATMTAANSTASGTGSGRLGGTEAYTGARTFTRSRTSTDATTATYTYSASVSASGTGTGTATTTVVYVSGTATASGTATYATGATHTDTVTSTSTNTGTTTANATVTLTNTSTATATATTTDLRYETTILMPDVPGADRFYTTGSGACEHGSTFELDNSWVCDDITGVTPTTLVPVALLGYIPLVQGAGSPPVRRWVSAGRVKYDFWAKTTSAAQIKFFLAQCDWGTGSPELSLTTTTTVNIVGTSWAHYIGYASLSSGHLIPASKTMCLQAAAYTLSGTPTVDFAAGGTSGYTLRVNGPWILPQ